MPTRVSIAMLTGFIAFAAVSHAVESWNSLGGPQGGDVRCLFSSPSIPGVVYVGLGSHGGYGSSADGTGRYGSGGGLFVSPDGGASWTRSRVQDIPVAGVAETMGTVLVATYGDGVFSGTEPWGTFHPFNDGLDDLRVRCINGVDTDVVLGTTTGPFYRSAGATMWVPGSMAGDRDVWALTRAPWDSALLLAATDSCVYRSTDAGETWGFAGSGLDQVEMRSVAFGGDGQAWAGSFAGWNDEAKLYESADSGKTWTEALMLSPGYEAVWTILVGADDPSRMMIGSGNLGSGWGSVYASTDGGSAWEEVLDVHYGHIRALLERPEDDEILAGCGVNGGVFRTTDAGDSWEWSVAGLDAGNVHAIDVLSEPDGTIIAGLGFQGSIALGHEWGTEWEDLDQQFPSIYVRDFLVSPIVPGRVLAAAWNDVYLTTDYGETWQSQDLGSQFVAVEASPSDPHLIYTGGVPGLFISMDDAQTWEGPDSTIGYDVTAVAVDPFNGLHAMVAAGGSLYETEDAGESWDTLSLQNVLSLAIHPDDPSLVYAGVEEGGFYVSTDGGDVFEQRINGLDSVDVAAVLPDPENPARVWAGTRGGVYVTEDLGLQWEEDNLGLENHDVRTLMVHNPTRRLYVGTYAGGVRVATIGVGAQDQGESWPEARRPILSVSPVPCNETLLILPRGLPTAQPGRVHVRLLDVLGREVMRDLIPLWGGARWDVRHVPPGTYFLRAGDNTLRGAATPVVVVR
jgi:photosystem II stability/assembly factor-like uncharacterized protein